MNYNFSKLLLIILIFTINNFSQEYKSRKEIKIPNISGYLTVKCDFHIHTIYSDGEVLPRTRIEEAWRDGLDVISLTEHLEYKNDDVKGDHNQSYEEAKNSARMRDLILIKGAEITKGMPPGHFNCLFTKDNNKLYNEDWRKSLKEAFDQGSFIMWNHPGWTQPNTIPIWYEEHEEIFNNGWMMGMEVVNEIEYYPLAVDWCNEKNITLIGNSDIHQPADMFFRSGSDYHRPMTLCFVEQKSKNGIKEALLKGRTAVYYKNKVIGKKEYLKEIFGKSIEIITNELVYDEWDRAYIQVRNNSSIPFRCEIKSENDKISISKKVVFYSNSITKFLITDKREDKKSKITLNVKVDNLIISSDKVLESDITVN